MEDIAQKSSLGRANEYPTAESTDALSALETGFLQLEE
jgi:hypothetical protein